MVVIAMAMKIKLRTKIPLHPMHFHECGTKELDKKCKDKIKKQGDGEGKFDPVSQKVK